MLRTIDKDTVLCMSLAARPGNFGTRFHNFLYREMGLNYLYKAFTTADLPGAIRGVRALGVRGCAISMPFKEAVIPLLDDITPSATAIGSVNTVVQEGGRLSAYNTDYIAVQALLARHAVPPDMPFLLRGSGGMARAVAAALRDAGFRHGTVIARRADAGRSLADSCGYRWHPRPDGLTAALLVNVTPIGMAGTAEADDPAFPDDAIDTARFVFDVVAMPAETPLIRAARLKGKTVITGAEVIALQALEQFVLYTGLHPSDDLVRRAAAYATGLDA